jgi:hypothetical protein
LIERWRAFDDRPFPTEAAAGEVNGVNLKSIESFGAMVVDRFLGDGALEWKDISLLLHCRSQLSRALPALSADARSYFAELDAILAQVIGDAATDPYKFSNVTGVELSQLLAQRVAERLSSLPSHEQFQAMLGAALIVVANTLQGPVKAATDPRQAAEQMIQLSADWLRKLLEPVFSGDGGKSA